MKPLTEIELDRLELAALRDKMNNYLSHSELRGLCYNMGIDYAYFSTSTKTTFTRELISYVERRGRMNELFEELRKARPKVDWR
jgi:hypothetical protein